MNKFFHFTTPASEPDPGHHFLEIRGIWKKFRIGSRPLDVLRGVSFHTDPGEWMTLLGASGSGKTTLLDIAGAISRPDAGEVLIDGVNPALLSSGSLVSFRRKNIGFVFQAYHLLPELNILENVMLPMMFSGHTKKNSCKRAESLLESVGLKDRLKHRPNELSGGEQQRTAIARALVNSPRLLLADEPTGNLDSVSGRGILELLQGIRAKHQTTILMVTHDPSVAALADRIVTLQDGVVV